MFIVQWSGIFMEMFLLILILSRVTKREGDIAKSLILKLDFAKKKGRLSFLKIFFNLKVFIKRIDS